VSHEFDMINKNEQTKGLIKSIFGSIVTFSVFIVMRMLVKVKFWANGLQDKIEKLEKIGKK
jgi:hypothetical protein